MEKELRIGLERKLSHLTCEGARDFWNEISEDLDSQIRKCERAVRDYRLPDIEVKKAQIQLFVCERLKGLPERLVESIRKQLADKPSSEEDGLKVANFVKPPDVA